MESVDRIEVRCARADDYDAVVELSRGIYDGGDYLPGLYHSYLEEQNRMCFVCECNGQVAGFIMTYVVDGGQTLVEQAARIHPSYRKRGLYHVMQEHSRRETFSKNPNLKRIAWTTWLVESMKKKTESKEIPAVIVTEKDSVRAKSTVSHISSLKGTSENSNSDRNTEIYDTTEKIKKVLLENLANSSVFPEDHVIVGWEPFRLLAENVEFISETASVVVKSWTDPEAEAKAISLGSLEIIASGVGYIMDFYGTDTNELTVHFDEHLRCLQKFILNRKADERVTLALWLPKGAVVDQWEGYIKERLSLEKVQLHVPQMVLLEMPLHG